MSSETGLWILYAIIIIVMVVSTWKVFVKAGRPGWACLIPIYDEIVVIQIASKPVWWILLMLIPLVNILVALIVYGELAKRFGRGSGFGFGLVFLPFIFMPILAFGDASFQQASA